MLGLGVVETRHLHVRATRLYAMTQTWKIDDLNCGDPPLHPLTAEPLLGFMTNEHTTQTFVEHKDEVTAEYGFRDTGWVFFK